jgi:hypothetical protein
MAVTNFTSLLGLALPTTGDLSGTWGTTVNDSITQLLDSAVAGTTTLSADADVTLSTTNGSSNQAREAILLWTASNGVTRYITAPAQSKAYVVINAGTASIVLRGAGPTAGITVIAGEKCLAAWNGSDFVKVGSTAIATANGFAGTNTNGTVTLTTTVTGLTKGNGTALSAAAAGTDYLAPPSGTSILKANSGGALANAVAGTDYLAPPSGTSVLKANSGGALANAVAGTDYLAPPSGTSILKANSGGALANAVAGTDYVYPSTATTFTAKQTFNGSTSVLAAVLANAVEPVTISATAATGTINYDVTTQSVLYYTSNASANWTMNFRASSGTSLDSAMSTGQAVTVVFMATNGATPYYNSTVQVDGSSVTPKYQGGIAWSYGTASGIDAYTYTIIKTGAAAFTVLASQIRFA